MSFVDNKWILAGLTSNGEGCARAGYPGIYTLVSNFISFINANVNFSGTQPPLNLEATTAAQQNSNQTMKNNKGNVIHLSISIWFSFLVFSLFTF
jgi:secreted trypsin-like serine protease